MPVMELLSAGAKKLGLELNPRQIEQFYLYYQELVDWNRRVNLTRITSYEGVQLKHFLDSLAVSTAWPALKPDANLRVIDIGTGAGLPGLALKIMFPDIKLTLLEATAKKTAFLSHLITKLRLENVQVVAGRAEESARRAEYRERFDTALARGVAPLATLVELTLPFCHSGGELIAQKKGDIKPEIAQAGRAISLLGGRLRAVKRIDLAEFSDERRLVIIDKVSPTPELYPRRPGIPSKRPILPHS